MRYLEVTAANTSVMSQIHDHREKFVQPLHPHFSRLCTLISNWVAWPHKKITNSMRKNIINTV